ncbi:hypothetical protein CFC21_020249 [Triticum aestivum]|uniref:Fucosyltransferase n=3 Tax=Triticum TaxID=4564 RepID=A0A9R1P9H1_TRITD|nr:galactoside 2-alpha-L-fucosyltransferase-like [Triticum aestivum]KAF7005102.1 hypothetical protein CFC21_020249 [Triticum aestivum]VAH39327.1 unnamed protein product [Triticum turgidum subsp. durum]
MASMDVERSNPAAPSWQAGLETVKKWQRIRCSMRRAWPAICVVAATLLAVVVLSAARDGYGLPMVPSSWLSVEDVPPSNLTTDQLLDGLLTAEFGSRSCRSRYEFASYHDKKKKKKHTSHKPSPYLLAKLRSHEALQKQCGPGTAPYRAAIRQLKSGNGIVTSDSENCRYLVPISYRGLGNRMLSTVSAFLYAVLTERTLLVQHDMAALFCEPFPRTTWLLPSSGWLGGGFPLGHLKKYGKDSKESLGNMLKANVLSVGDNGNASWSDSDRPPYVYLHLDGGYGFYDKLFYCDEQQRLIRGAPWLLMRTDSYLVPGLFLIPSFRDELERMFPEKDVAFHHLGRYLFHPANDVWRAVTRYYDAHLAGAGQRVGIQIRVFTQNKPLQKVLDQVLSCVRREKLLLPSIQTNNASVLVTSLSSWYYERIKAEYGGSRVHQPSHEGWQKMRDASQDRKALSEMYLLSTCDVLVTTGFSTFGYVAQGLGGILPWIMPATPFWSTETGVVPDPPCMRAMSVEPCFHSPSNYGCAARKDVDVGTLVPYIRHCEDASWGIKIANESMQPPVA